MALEPCWPRSFTDIGWAALFFRATAGAGYDKAYMSLFKSNIRTNVAKRPYEVSDQEMEEFVRSVIGFLNDYKMRFQGRNALSLSTAIREVSSNLQGLSAERLETISFSSEVFDSIKRAFTRPDDVRGIGATGASKLLGILNPALFVMWDQAICEKYFSRKSGFIGQDYVEFLIEMQRSAKNIGEDIRTRFSHNDPGGLLSNNLKIEPHLPLAKFIDEYNWITITNGFPIPPTWHPD